MGKKIQEREDEMVNPENAPVPDGEESVDDGGAHSEAANSALEEIKRERDELREILVRKQAEFENFRKRTERERSEFVQFAAAGVVEGLLEVLDSFELAIRDGVENRNAASMHKGFELIFKQLFDRLERHGLETIEAEGQAFDPHVHQAVSTQPTGKVPPGMVLEELRKGYTLNGRLLRPAMVIVAAAEDGTGTEKE